MTINTRINQLITYAKNHFYLELDDQYYAVNGVLYLLGIDHFHFEDCPEDPDFFEMMDDFLAYAIKKHIIHDTVAAKDAFEAKLVDCFLPRPSTLTKLFRQHYKKGPMTAMTFFHELSVATNYIKTRRIAKNIKYQYQGKYTPLDITINLSKPEKDPQDIQKQSQQNNAYPACPLCMENIGVYQSTSLAPRSNHRVISLTLNHEEDAWGLQYSPYAYFNEHLIVLRKEHRPMYVNALTFAELVDFINKFPQYLIGSNAGLPIVGGSILNHHHFQGGRYDFPIEKAKSLLHYKRKKVSVEVLDWPMAVIRISSNNENALLDAVNDVYAAWQKYDRPELKIHAHTDADHNTVTPILKLNGSMYQFYIVLRNNFATVEKPYGLFHPREAYFHIKKENIGLIEVMGMAILPGRLVNELSLIEHCLVNHKNPSDFPELDKHQSWIETLQKMSWEDKDIKAYLKQDVGRIFEAVLEDCNVFKYGTNEDLFRFVEKAI